MLFLSVGICRAAAPVADASGVVPASEQVASNPNEQEVESIRRAMAAEPAAVLAETIDRAAEESPNEYREALRRRLHELLPRSSRLERHLVLVDLDQDGWVEPGENYRSLRDLGFGPAKALAVAAGSQMALALKSGNPFRGSFPVNGERRLLHKPVDTGAFETDAPLEQKLDEIMAEDLDGDGVVRIEDIERLIDVRAGESDAPAVARALTAAVNKGEFAALFALVGGTMTRADLRDFYTGSLWFALLPPERLAERLVGMRERLPRTSELSSRRPHGRPPAPGHP